MAKIDANVFSEIMMAIGIYGHHEEQLSIFVHYFKQERLATEIIERFQPLATRDCIRLIKQLGHNGSHATTVTGLCRLLLNDVGIKLISKNHERNNRKYTCRVYQIDNCNQEITQPEWVWSDRPIRRCPIKGYVYFARANDYPVVTKIGCTTNPVERLKTLNMQAPFLIHYEWILETDDMYFLEFKMHERFANKRKYGEWFELSQSEIDNVKFTYRAA